MYYTCTDVPCYMYLMRTFNIIYILTRGRVYTEMAPVGQRIRRAFASCKLPSQRVLLLLAIPVCLLSTWAAFNMCWPSVREELLLLFQCHLNESHLAQENVRLTREIEVLRNQVAELRDKNTQCLDDNDAEHSRANRSYWEGVTFAMATVGLVAITIFYCCVYICCVGLAGPQYRQGRRGRVAIR